MDGFPGFYATMSAVIQRVASRLADAIGHESAVVKSVRPAYEQLLWWSSLGRGIPWTINKVVCRIDPRERHRMARQYDEPVARWLSARIEPGDSSVNVGANTGVYVIQLAHWSGPAGQVVAFEPNPAARRILARHVRMNRLDERVGSFQPLCRIAQARRRSSRVMTVTASAGSQFRMRSSPAQYR